MRKIHYLLVASLTLSACAGIRHNVEDWPAIDCGPKPDMAVLQPEVESRISESLIDPESARFTGWTEPFKSLNSFLSTDPIEGIWQFCVNVNAKNRFGGYVGASTFMVKVRDDQILSIDGSDSDQAYYKRACKEGAISGHAVMQ
jgi:hypothetical protein